jgi:hypothetical protein
MGLGSTASGGAMPKPIITITPCKYKWFVCETIVAEGTPGALTVRDSKTKTRIGPTGIPIVYCHSPAKWKREIGGLSEYVCDEHGSYEEHRSYYKAIGDDA